MTNRPIIRKANLNSRVRPQDDFFEFANGGWIAKNPIPKEEAAWGTYRLSIRDNENRLKELVHALRKKRVARGTPAQLVRDFWIAGMDKKTRSDRGFAPIKKYADRIDRISQITDLVALVADFHRDGLGMLWGAGVGIDDKNSNLQVFHIAQDGLSLPDRDFYIKQTPEYKNIRSDLVLHIARMLEMYGINKKDATKTAREILSIETKLARLSMTAVALRDPHAQYNPHTLSQLKQLTPRIDWQLYLKRLGARTSRIIVCQPKFFKGLNELLRSVSLDNWKGYFLWHLILGTSGYLSESIAQAQFNFYGTRLQGTPEMKPLWRRVLSTIDFHVGDALGQLYVTRYFPPRAKKRMDTLVENLVLSSKERIQNLEWMTPATKRRALRKLAAIIPKIGYPSKWEKYRGLSISPFDHFGNVIRTNRYEHARQMRKLGKRPDRSEWLITAPTINAYFHPNLNEIVFPAGILQWPAFDLGADDAVNYGAIGSIIGHEITHAFDDEGRQFDHKGNLVDWWTKNDATEFKKRADVLRKVFDAFEVLPGQKVNGKLTLGENIADLGGIIIAFNAWKKTRQSKSGKKIDGFTGAQRFFLANAFFEAESMRKEAQKKRLVTDPHAPSRFRINGPLPHVDAFYEAFAVEKGHKMYIPEAKRVRIW